MQMNICLCPRKSKVLLAIRLSWGLRTFSVVTEAHLRLAKANGVFPLTDAIELLKLGLVDALNKIGSESWLISNWTTQALRQNIHLWSEFVPDLGNISLLP